jgi:hypothetical protein
MILGADMIEDAVKLLFPGHELTHSSEVNGLIKGTVPQNCVIIASGQQTRTTDRCEFYLVEVGKLLVFLRVCTASPDSDYDEFAVIHAWEPLGTGDAEDLRIHQIEKIKLICEPSPEQRRAI